MRQTKVKFWESQVASQIKWIEEHGGDLAGYVARYGAANDPNKYGNGGEAIYRADVDYLNKMHQEWNRALAGRRS